MTTPSPEAYKIITDLIELTFRRGYRHARGEAQPSEAEDAAWEEWWQTGGIELVLFTLTTSMITDQ